MAERVEGLRVPADVWRLEARKVGEWLNGDGWRLTRGTDFPVEMGWEVLRHRLRAALTYRVKAGVLPPSRLKVWEEEDSGDVFVKVEPT